MTAGKNGSQHDLFGTPLCALCSRSPSAYASDEHGGAWFCRSCCRSYLGAMLSVGWTVPGFIQKMGGNAA